MYTCARGAFCIAQCIIYDEVTAHRLFARAESYARSAFLRACDFSDGDDRDAAAATAAAINSLEICETFTRRVE